MKINKTQKFIAIFGVLCIIVAIHNAYAAPASTYVGVKAGDKFEYTVVAEGTDIMNPWPGTYDMTITIGFVTDSGGSANVQTVMVIKNSTFTSPPSSPSSTIYETDINITTMNNFVINKNISNKTYVSYSTGAGSLSWINATFDANGVMDSYSMLAISSGVVEMHITYTRKPGIPGYPALLLCAFAAIAVGFLVKKKLHLIKGAF